MINVGKNLLRNFQFLLRGGYLAVTVGYFFHSQYCCSFKQLRSSVGRLNLCKKANFRSLQIIGKKIQVRIISAGLNTKRLFPYDEKAMQD